MVLAEVGDLVLRDVVAGQVEPRVEEHRAVARAEDEAVAVDPGRVVGVEGHGLAEEDRAHLGGAERQAEVAGLGRGDRVHREAARLVGGGLEGLGRGRGDLWFGVVSCVVVAAWGGGLGGFFFATRDAATPSGADVCV